MLYFLSLILANSTEFDLARAESNLAAILNGTRFVQQLTPSELEQVLLLRDWRTRRGFLKSETRKECLEREQTAEPSRLERAVADLKCSQKD